MKCIAAVMAAAYTLLVNERNRLSFLLKAYTNFKNSDFVFDSSVKNTDRISVQYHRVIGGSS